VSDVETVRRLYDEERSPGLLVDALLRAERGIDSISRSVEDVDPTTSQTSTSTFTCLGVLGEEVSWWREQVAVCLGSAWKNGFFCCSSAKHDFDDDDDSRKLRITFSVSCAPFDAPVSQFAGALLRMGMLDDCLASLARQVKQHLGDLVTLRRKSIANSPEDLDASLMTGNWS
jgi:hypothetical protein